MTTELTVLEKLKLSKEELDSLNCVDHEAYEDFLALQLKVYWRIKEILPRIITALELAKRTAEDKTIEEKYGVHCVLTSPRDGAIWFARNQLKELERVE